MDKYLENANPSIEELKDWAYDEELYLIEQDEDLILHSPQYIAPLMEFASDKDCPKSDYCLSILNYYSRILLANRMTNEIVEVEKQITGCHLLLSYNVEKWKASFLYFTDLINHPRAITESEADEIAWQLTVGDYCYRDFKKLDSCARDVLEFSASTSSYIEYFYIHLKTSNWKLSRHFRLDDAFKV